MGQVKVNKFKISNKKISSRMVLISDIHYYNKKDEIKLKIIYETIKNLSPNYICILGDTCDQAKIFDENVLIDWLKQLSEITVVIMVYGNHDIALYDSKTEWLNDKLFNKIKRIKNLYLLDNEVINIEGINFIGLKLDYNYYYDKKEDPKEFIKHYNALVKNLDDKNYNVLLSHSPIALTKNHTLLQLNDYKNIDLILCGHMHGGMMPDLLRPIFKNRGLIGPSKRGIFIRNAYGHFKVNNINFIVSSGVTKLSNVSRMNCLDSLFNPEVILVELDRV